MTARHAPEDPHGDVWVLRLYVSGQTLRSLTAYANLKRICDEYLPGRYRIETIDVSVNPKWAVEDQIVAIPTTVRVRPEPVRRLIGDLSNLRQVLMGFEISTEVNFDGS
ncbi:MAG: circadian clock KaiB family protein [Bryobacterales bacterium]|nr:circadian clock KaiB family protein [Bryobacterales bacterium]